MTPADDSVIAAVATPAGRGGIGIVRVSGGDIKKIIAGVLPKKPAPRAAVFSPFLDENGEAMDRGLALYFPAPRSFTGQEVLELHCHGGGGVLRRVLSRCFALGARAAEPGEFTLRAYLNGKMDLAQASAVADLVNAASDDAARSAMRSLSGEFSDAIHSAARDLETARVESEAMTDFADEDLGANENNAATVAIESAIAKLESLRVRAGQGALLADGISAAIVGRPNVGKSSLLNRLAGEDAAIVSQTPGTTRDAIAREVVIGGLRVSLSDTAGLRSGTDALESEGIRRAKKTARESDLILHVSDDNDRELSAQQLRRQLNSESDLDSGSESGSVSDSESESVLWTGRVILIRNKIDIIGESPGVRGGVVYMSAKTGAGLNNLRGEILRVAGADGNGNGTGGDGGESPFAARVVHLRALDVALECARRAREDLSHPELAAENLRRARDALSEMTGAFGDEELLGEIFSRFCAGK